MVHENAELALHYHTVDQMMNEADEAIDYFFEIHQKYREVGALIKKIQNKPD